MEKGGNREEREVYRISLTLGLLRVYGSNDAYSGQGTCSEIIRGSEQRYSCDRGAKGM